ncbi:MAG TPA: hypothetical protein VMS56_11915 [Thermoanaerobaculia bacterium]|nr:hypothetical protein [Thermoanaerobaculia bacterium]
MTDSMETTTLVFDRTPVARLASCAAAFGSAALFFDYLSRSPDRLSPLALAGLGVLVVGSVLAALLQYGDHIYVGPEGLLYVNRWLPIARKEAGWMRWDEVVEVREVRRKILLLLSSDGRRLPVDSIAAYPLARREILRRTPHAVISGTLTREDRP